MNRTLALATLALSASLLLAGSICLAAPVAKAPTQPNPAKPKPAATKPAAVHAKMVDGTLVLFPTNPSDAILVRYKLPGLDAWVSATRTGGKTHQVRIYSRVRKKATITFRYPFGDQSATWNRPVTRKGDLVSVTLGWHQILIGELMDVDEGADAADATRRKLGTTSKADANLPIVYYSGDSISLGNWPWVEAALWNQANLYYQREVWEHIPAARSKNNGHAHMAYSSLLKAYKDKNFQPDYLMVNFGLHMVNPYSKRQEQYGPCVQKFVDLAKAKGAKLIWVTTTPYASKSKAKNPIIENFNAQAIAIAKKHNIPVIDLYTFIQAQVKAKGEANVYPPDGVHFTEATKKAMGAFMAKRVREILKLPAQAKPAQAAEPAKSK